MLLFKNRADLEEWLKKQPNEVGQVLAVRAALRAVPYFQHKRLGADSANWTTNVITPFLIGLGTPWLRLALSDFPIALLSAAEFVASPIETHEALINSFLLEDQYKKSAASAAIEMACDKEDVRVRLIGLDPAKYSQAIVSTKTLDSQMGQEAYWPPESDDYWRAVSADADKIEINESAANLLFHPLWEHKSVASQESDVSWQSIKGLCLLSSDPEAFTWLKWYETMRDGKISRQVAKNMLLALPVMGMSISDHYKRIARYLEIAALSADDEIEESFPDSAIGNPLEEFVTLPPERAAIEPKPITGLASAFNYSLSSNGKITAEPGDLAKLGVDFPIGRDDFSKHVKAYKKLVRNLIKSLEEKKYNCRSEFLDCLRSAEEEFGSGDEFENFALINAEIRTLIGLWREDQLPTALKVRLTTLVQHHFGLRAFYPNMYGFYQAINQGALDGIAPIDAIISFKSAISEELSEMLDDEGKKSFALAKDDVRNGLIDNFTDDYLSRDFVSDSNIATDIPKDPLGDPDSMDYWARFNAVNFNSLLTLIDNASNLLNKSGTFIDATDKFIARIKPLWPMIRDWLSPHQ